MALGIDVATHTRIEVAELLTAMLSVPSPSGEEDAVASLLVSRLLRAGFDVDVDAAGNVVAGWGEGAETIALVGHIDTVPGHIGVRRDGDLLHGRGAVDAKGPLAAAIAAVSRQPRDGARRYVIVGAVEEETTSRGARHLAASMAGSVRTGHSRAEWLGRGDHRIQGEPAAARERRPATRPRRGSRAERARPLCRPGSSAPGSRRAVRWRRGCLRPGGRPSAGVRLGERWIDRSGERGSWCSDPPGCDVDALIEVARSSAPTAALTVLGREPGVRTDRRSRLARGFVSAIRTRGGTPRFKLKTGTSDLNILGPAWGCQAVAYGPGDSQLDHTPREHVSIAELERAVSVLELALGAG